MVINVAYRVTKNPSAMMQLVCEPIQSFRLSLTLRDVFSKSFHLPLELRSPRMQLMPDVIVEELHVFIGPVIYREQVREDGIVLFVQLGRDAVSAAGGVCADISFRRFRYRVC